MTSVQFRFTTRPETKMCELKKEGAENDRKFHYAMDIKRPTSGPKFCPEPGKILRNIVEYISSD